MNTPTFLALEGASILVIDDTPANVAVLADCLEELGLRVVVAQDGEEGLGRAEFVRPDLILLDVMMPVMDGFETCRRLKLNEITRDIPVIFMTALTDMKSMVTAFDVGGVDYISKPFQMEEVLARVNTHLSLRAMHRQLSSQNLALQHEVETRRQAQDALKTANEAQQLLIAKLQDAHEQLVQSEKMASIGQLAAGIAHEINNPIGFVSANMGSLQTYFATLISALEACESAVQEFPLATQIAERFAQVKLDSEIDFLKADVVDLMKESRDGLNRVKDIVHSLREFSHVGESLWQEADLHQGLESTLNMVNHEIKYKAQVVREYGALPLVKCLASQLNQVFLNLFVNASHAIEGSGTIRVRTGCRDAWVWVEISDTGSGMSPDIVNRIFDPFFTTKPVGSGTGLGLSLSYGIVRKHGGRIEVRSELGHGSSFTVHLPIDPEQTLAPAL
jgi:two-component system, NtrC family, sensor kinase